MSLVQDMRRGELYCTTCERSFEAGQTCPTDGTRLLRLKARIDPFLGRDLDGRFTILEKLGSGAMGAVYRAQQHSIDREVAVKVVNPNLITDDEVIKRFLREAKLASKLAHPNAVSVLEFGQTEDGTFYLVMELVSGRTLGHVIETEHVLRPERVVRIGMQILDALDGAHALEIVHRDLKPSNIMVLSHGRDLIKVLDFGLAKSTSPEHTAATMTGTNAVVGTPAFMPPELARGIPCDGRADLYSLGVVLYLMGTGRLPFESASVPELVAMHGNAEPAPPMAGVPARLAAVVAKLLEKERANRYQTAAEALVALEGALAAHDAFRDRSLIVTEPRARSSPQLEQLSVGETLLAAPATAVSNVAPARPRRWQRLAIAIGALVAAAAAGAVLVTRSGDDERPAVPRVPAATAPTPTLPAPPVSAPAVPVPTSAPPAAPPATTELPAAASSPATAEPSAAKPKRHKPRPNRPGAQPPKQPSVAPAKEPSAAPPSTGSGAKPPALPF